MAKLTESLLRKMIGQEIKKSFNLKENMSANLDSKLQIFLDDAEIGSKHSVFELAERFGTTPQQIVDAYMNGENQYWTDLLIEKNDDSSAM